MYNNNIIENDFCQEKKLFDKSNKKKKWSKRKKESLLVGDSFERIYEREYKEFESKWSSKRDQLNVEYEKHKEEYDKYCIEVLEFYKDAESFIDKEYIPLDEASYNYKNNLIEWHISKGYKPLQPKKSKLLLEYEADKKYIDSLNSKIGRINKCSDYLAFGKDPASDDMELLFANFCQVRLCPMCSWRKSLQVFAEVSQVMDHVEGNHDLRYIFLTLTVRNCIGEDLSKTIDELFRAYSNMTKRVAFQKAVKGFFRAFEVTYNRVRDDYHPHFHVILGVNKSYFNDSKIYLSHKKWVKLWKEALGIDYDPIVDVRTLKDKNEIREEIIKNRNMDNINHNVISSLANIDNDKKTKSQSLGSAIAEIAKYTVKSEDYLIRDEEGNLVEDVTDEVIKTLDEALMNRRLHAYGLLFADARKEILKQKELEEEDHIIREDVGYMMMFYNWNYGFGNYSFNPQKSKELTEKVTSESGLDLKEYRKKETGNNKKENNYSKHELFDIIYTPIHKKK